MILEKFIQAIRFYSLFFVALFCLLSCQPKQDKDLLSEILERGSIRLGTLYGSTNYYLDAEGPTGFEYELAQAFAEELGVTLEVRPSFSLNELFDALANEEVDFLGANLIVTPERMRQFKLSPSYNAISQKLVFKQGKERPRNLEQITGVLEVVAGSSHDEKLQQVKSQYPNHNWNTNDSSDPDEMLTRVLDEEIDYTIADSNSLAINRRYYPEISIGFTLAKESPVSWLLNKQKDDSLLAAMIEFFGQQHQQGMITSLVDKYFGHVGKFNYVDTRTFIKAVETKLPKYKPLFTKYAGENDWRLLAAISYQESHWNPRAKSPTGVRGMMMLTLPTARQMGVTSRLDPEQSVKGGARYFTKVHTRIPARIKEPDRTWFALAAYNIGWGHLEDARIITQQLGGDADKWVDVRKHLPLLKRKAYYKKTRYGYARGDEPVNYVANIRRYLDTLIWLDEKQQQDDLLKQQQDQIEENLLQELDATTEKVDD